MSRPGEGLTLRDKCREAHRVMNELSDHLERSFLPKVGNLQKITRTRSTLFDPSQIRDVTVRTHAAAILEAEQYSIRLDEEAKSLLTAIAGELDHLLDNGAP